MTAFDPCTEAPPATVVEIGEHRIVHVRRLPGGDMFIVDEDMSYPNLGALAEALGWSDETFERAVSAFAGKGDGE